MSKIQNVSAQPQETHPTYRKVQEKNVGSTSTGGAASAVRFDGTGQSIPTGTPIKKVEPLFGEKDILV